MYTIALARPHPMIISAMKRLIEEAGCSAYEINSVTEIRQDTSLLVVSTAPPSATILPNKQSRQSTQWQYFHEVVEDLRKHHPLLPIVLTTLNQTTDWMLPILRGRLPIARILGVSVEALNHEHLRDPNTFVAFRKHDIEPDSHQFATARLMLKELTAWRP